MGRPPKAKTELAQRLVEIRGDRTRDEFALQYGVSPRAYANYERGDNEPGFAFLQEIVAAEHIRPAWLFSGEGSPRGEVPDNLILTDSTQTTVIDPDLLKQIARIVSRVHAEAEIRLPADAQATELANAYNLLMAKAEDPVDPLELKSLLPWLETHLTKTLKQALKEPGAGKREA
ncbi:helix-turn-helix transcriptional regulator [Labrenzia sp. R4_2]|uniref:helix-turn-helix domain-containing protein n=1 Tax=Labrenzia sp. R4_2 TaxID=2821107 RepID=UPI001ADB4483|nr:helix-turn-helix transcriptional regulator [Labrenzia sp. R4_2]MBO9419184.1 helix-turn-helix transcriptional regulator [Labrenzia sp. R4_2]